MINQYEGALPKNGAWTVCQFKGELDKKDRDGVFDGVDTPMQDVSNCYWKTLYVIQTLLKT